MNLTERISSHRDDLSRSDLKVAEYLTRMYPQGLLENATTLGRIVGVNSSTVTRFFRKIGYESIREARLEVKDEVSFVMNSPVAKYRMADRSPGRAPIQKVVEHEIALIRSTFDGISSDAIEQFVELLRDDTRSVYIIGARKIHTLSFYLYFQLNAVRENVHLIRPDGNYLPETLMDVKAGDILVAFDFRRYPKIIRKTAEFFRESDGKIVLVSDSPAAPIKSLADVNFVVATKGTAIFDSHTSTISLLNALLGEYVNAVGTGIKARLARMENVTRHFDVFTWHD